MEESSIPLYPPHSDEESHQFLLEEDQEPVNCTTEALEYNIQNCSSYLNITTQFPIKYAQTLFGYCMPFLFVITLIANTLIVVVLAKRHMRTPTNVVLLAMALADMFTGKYFLRKQIRDSFF